MHTYQVYNTIINSDLQLLNIPESPAADSKVRIIKVDIPSVRIPLGEFGTFYSKSCCALGVECGTLEVSDGLIIKVFINDGHTDDEMGPFIIGWGFAFLFSQQNYTVFHCSALNICGKGVMLSGVSGAGKSSTALSLINSGAKYLADDMAVLKPSESLNILPSYPIQKVCRDVSGNMSREQLLRINEGRDKFSYHNETDFCSLPTEITHLVLLSINEGSEIILQEHTGLNKWLKALECLYMTELYASLGVPDTDKYGCLKIAEKVHVLEISRPEGKNTLGQITEIINNFVIS